MVALDQIDQCFVIALIVPLRLSDWPMQKGAVAYATIMVDVGFDAAPENRVRLAADLADRFGAALIGAAGYPPAPPFISGGIPFISGGIAIAPLVTLENVTEQEIALGRQEDRFREIVAGARCRIEWRSSIGPADEFLARQARAADLIVVGGETSAGYPYALFDAGALLMNAGRPVLMVPNNLERLLADRVAVAWKDTREARRALADSLPFVKVAEKTFVVEVCEQREADSARRSVSDVVNYLLRHGITTAVGLVLHEGGVTDELLRFVRTEQIDLVVAGAYGRSRLGEWVFGGVTRDLLRKSPICCLFSH
jgi:nucleotide-binding universal stress UspA family protein